METPEDKSQGTNSTEETPTTPPAAKAPVKPAAKAPVKPAAKKAVNTTNNKGTAVIAHDPKNRHVYLEKKGEKFKVSKPATGFVFEGSEKKAKEVFEHQKTCSHN